MKKLCWLTICLLACGTKAANQSPGPSLAPQTQPPTCAADERFDPEQNACARICASESQCGDTQHCNAAGFCISRGTCSTTKKCADGDQCVGGQCTKRAGAGGCENNGQCETGRVCVAGNCVTATPTETACEADADCEGSVVCLALECTCNAAHECVPPEGNATCTLQTAHTVCGATQRCDVTAQLCVDAEACVVDGDCGFGLQCLGGYCKTAKPCDDGACDAGFTCVASFCFRTSGSTGGGSSGGGNGTTNGGGTTSGTTTGSTNSGSTSSGTTTGSTNSGSTSSGTTTGSTNSGSTSSGTTTGSTNSGSTSSGTTTGSTNSGSTSSGTTTGSNGGATGGPGDQYLGDPCWADEDCDPGCSGRTSNTYDGSDNPRTFGWSLSDYVCNFPDGTHLSPGVCQYRCIQFLSFELVGCPDPTSTTCHTGISYVGAGTGYCGASSTEGGYSACEPN